MIGRAKLPRRHGVLNPVVQSLEPRRLLTGWTTVEDYNPPGGSYFQDITADSGGNLYVAGHEGGRPIIREKLAGDSSFSTIFSSPDSALVFTELATNAAGDLYVAGHNANYAVGGGFVMRRAAGQSTFTTIDSSPVYINDLAIDSAGDVFTVGSLSVTTTTTTKKGKTTTTTSTTVSNWVVRKQTAGQGTFATVDQYLYSAGAHSTANGISVVESGPNAGIYVVGTGQSTTQPGAALVRKSTNGGTSWTTASTFRYQSTTGVTYDSSGDAITADAAGNIYVTGIVAGNVVTRKSTNGSSFAIVDAMPAIERYNVLDVHAMVVDNANNVYVVGMSGRAGAIHGYTRSNVGGTWATVDDVLGSSATSFHGVTVDPAGNVFVCGMINTHGTVRTNAPPAATIFSSQRISGDLAPAGSLGRVSDDVLI